MPNLINRPEYLKQLIQSKDVDFFKIITGIRRCGKSSLLDLFHQYLSENGAPDANIIHMNLESLRYRTVGRYDVKGKQFLKTLGKHYICDMGFRNMLLGYRDTDRGHTIENIVFLELLRRDYRVYIGKVGETEVDFIAEKSEDKFYIQVTESIQSPEIRERELRPLRMIQDNYEKVLLSMDRDFIKSYDGIKSLNLIDWLSA